MHDKCVFVDGGTPQSEPEFLQVVQLHVVIYRLQFAVVDWNVGGCYRVAAGRGLIALGPHPSLPFLGQQLETVAHPSSIQLCL